MARVVDTNVGVVANGRSDQADPACVQAAIRALRHIQQHDLVVIDDDYYILREYRRYLSPTGQPGPGDAFVRWLILNQANPKRCEQVRITARGGNGDDFEEFSADPDLAGFDRSDRKFVAVALVSAHRPAVLNATDTRSWPVYRSQLARHGIVVECLCPHLMEQERSEGGD